ncbi:transketolase [Alphaproteobacteria bacterium]|nr:transketolase [Alphaproteobacteria bacterium]
MRKTCLDMVYELAKNDERVIFIGSDLGPGTLSEMQKNMPDRFFMEGVNEANIIGMAAGLAMDGYIPFVNTIATFITRRCYEQIAIDLCLHNLSVNLIGNGGGLVYAPLGPTHLAIEDISIMRSLPNMKVFCPSDAEEMKRLMGSSLSKVGPSYIRLAKGGDKVISKESNGFKIGRSILMKKAKEILIISTGITTAQALEASNYIEKDNIESGIGVLHVHTIKPLDKENIIKYSRNVDFVLTVEEHLESGGLGTAVGECLNDSLGKQSPEVIRLGIPDKFPDKYGSQDQLLKYYGLDSKSISKVITNLLGRISIKAA